MKPLVWFAASLLALLGSSCLDQAAVAAEAAPAAAPRAGAQPVTEESVIRGFDPAAPDQSILALAKSGMSASKLAFEKTAIDFGQIYQFESIPFEFPFTVEGTEPVILTRVDSNCGCTDARIRADWEMNAPGADPAVEKLYVYGREIPAGARGTVIGTFTSERRFGDKSTIITVHGNMANTPVRLDLHTNIRALFDVKPGQVKFGDVLAGAVNGAAPQEVRVVCRSPFEVVQWKRLPPGVKVEPVGEPEATGFKTETARRFRVTLGPDAPEGMLSASCIAETSIKMDLEIMVIANVTGPVSYTPSARIAFGMVPSGEERSRTIDLESSMPALVLPAPVVEMEGEILQYLKASVETVEAGRFHRVRLTLPANLEPSVITGLVRLKYPEGSGLAPREFPITGRVVKSGPKEPQ